MSQGLGNLSISVLVVNWKTCRLRFWALNIQVLLSLIKYIYDLWGPIPVLYISKFKYYACLVNDLSKYN